MVLTTEDANKCREKINSCLNRWIPSRKLSNSNGVFQHYDQHTINTFYEYCLDKHVLPKIDETGEELESIGFINTILEVQQKWHILSALAEEKALSVSTIKRPSSTSFPSKQIDDTQAIEHTKPARIILSYCQRDVRRCQHLIKQLPEEGLSIWAKPAILEQERDASFHIDKSDCVVLCISENSYENQSCEKEARYSIRTRKPVFLVKIQNHPLIGWQRELFYAKSLFQLFSSKPHLDLECGRFLLNIVSSSIHFPLHRQSLVCLQLQCTKPSYDSLIQKKFGRQQISNHEYHSLLPLEQQILRHEEKIRTLMSISNIKDEEMHCLIEQLQSVMNSTDPDEKKSDEQEETTKIQKNRSKCII
jgi:hypothetical protein